MQLILLMSIGAFLFNIINKDGDFGRGYNVEKVSGFFYIGPIDCIDLEFTDEDDYFSVSGISTEPDIYIRRSTCSSL